MALKIVFLLETGSLTKPVSPAGVPVQPTISSTVRVFASESVGETSGARDGPTRSRQKLWRQAARRATIVAHSGTKAGTPLVLVRSP